MAETGAVTGIAVRGLRELNQALAKADRDTRLGIRGEYRTVAQPVRMDAERFALDKIRRIKKSPKWAEFRIGITQKFVYVAPRKRGVKTRGPDPRRRGFGTGPPSFADLLMDRAMEPALRQHEGQIQQSFDEMLDRVADKFNH